MANVKISNLTAATTPLAGTEVLPIVQSGATVKASIANVQTAVYPGGTANGVAYLNGSKVLTTGSALVFDGTNLGVGVTPSAWGSGITVIQLAKDTSVSSHTTGGNIFVNSNTYYNGSNWIYSATRGASQYQQNNGAHIWYQAGSGTAGNAISFTQAMTLDGSGNLGVGTTSITSGGGWTPRLVLAAASGSPAWIIKGASNQELSIGASESMYIDCLGATTGANNNIIFRNTSTNSSFTPVERARIDSSGNLLVGTTNASQGGILRVVSASAEFGTIATFGYTANGSSVYILDARATGQNNSGTAMLVLKNTSTSRSISAAGTINASGADYAEYMTKAGDFAIAKGDVVGIDSNGKLTNVFADAVSFMVKSTDPSYVGGDSWGSEEALGLAMPEKPSQRQATEEIEAETDEDFATRLAQYETDKSAFDAALEAARQRVDRIAFAGQVPVNVMGATAGQYIIPMNDNGAIKGEAVSNPTFEQYQTAVGKVIAIESDGRARIIVKVA